MVARMLHASLILRGIGAGGSWVVGGAPRSGAAVDPDDLAGGAAVGGGDRDFGEGDGDAAAGGAQAGGTGGTSGTGGAGGAGGRTLPDAGY